MTNDTDTERMGSGQDELDAICWSIVEKYERESERADGLETKAAEKRFASRTDIAEYHNTVGRRQGLTTALATLEKFGVDVDMRAERHDPDEHDHGETQ